MAFTVETGAGLSDANAYVDVAYYSAYLADRAMTEPAGTDNTARQANIIKASDFLDRRYRRKIIGIRLTTTQALEFPRTGAYYPDGRVVSGVAVEWKMATVELAWRLLTVEISPDPDYDDTNRVVIRKAVRVGSLSEDTQYADDGVILTWRKFPTIEGLIAELVSEGEELLRA